MRDERGELAALLRGARAGRGWSQLDLAAEADLTQATVARLETGRVRHPRPRTLAPLAAALELPVAALAAAADRDALDIGR